MPIHPVCLAAVLVEDSECRWRGSSETEDKQPLVLAPAACLEAGNDREGIRVVRCTSRFIGHFQPIRICCTRQRLQIDSCFIGRPYVNATGSDGGGLFGSGGFRIAECHVHSEVLPLVAASLVLEEWSSSLVVMPTGAAASGSFGATSGGSLFGAAGPVPLDCSKLLQAPAEVGVQAASLERVL